MSVSYTCLPAKAGLLDVGGDVPKAVPHSVHRNDLLLQVVGQDPLALLDYLGAEAAVAVLRCFYRHFPVAALDGLLLFAVALVAHFPALLHIGQMPFHLRLERLFKELLQYWGKRTVLAEQRLPV